ncbi:arylsulfatase [uncultured Gimesia sp.]|uniref:arylsulfatase n=1 Tax=uncultured Gimesia sp. TaxID=1678688 RepID=UPI0030D9C62C|tara:strand:- start:36006 stop:37775 length:1770 start_codon:yes stop_codon:yes gene_type:complete
MTFYKSNYLIGTILVSLMFCNLTSEASAAKHTNVILIMTDDQGGWDYGFMGNKILNTPNLDAMAAGGARLSRFYVSPVCTPTRANLMTGRYNYRTRAIDTYIGRAMMEPEETTIAEVLAPAGYKTGIFGKWHLGDSYPMRPQDQGFQEALVHRGGGIGQPSDPPEGAGKYTDPVLFHNGEQKQMKGYCTDIYFDHAMKFIQQNESEEKPTFMYIATNAPHGPFHDVPEDLRQKYKAMDLNDAYGFDLNKRRKNAKQFDKTSRVFSMIENIDQNIGKLFQHLKQIGAYENTLVLFLNDNGPNGPRFVGAHRGMKGRVNEGGIRSVLLAHWPAELKAGTVNDRIAAHYDVFPTILAATGVEQPEALELDGVNVLPLLKNQAQSWPERTLFLQWHRGDEPTPRTNAAAVTQDYKMTFSKENEPGKLFHLGNDPRENKDLAGEKAKLAKNLTRQYNDWFADVSSTRPDNYAPPRIHVGNSKEPTTVLTRQDWRYAGPKGKGWTRDARGNWLVTVEQAGSYDIKVQFQKQQDRVTTELTVKVGDDRFQAKVPADQSEYIFKNVSLHQGKQTVDVKVAEGSIERGPMFVYLTKNK